MLSALLLIPLCLAVGGSSVASAPVTSEAAAQADAVAPMAPTLESGRSSESGSSLEQDGFVWSPSGGEAQRYSWSQSYQKTEQIRDESGYLWSRSR